MDQTRALVDDVISQFGRIDILVNNAGMSQVGDPEAMIHLAQLSPREWHKSIDRNLTTCFNVTHAVLPHMLKNKYGRIVNISSVTGPLVINPGEAAYSASKAAMVGMGRSLAMEVAREGITVNSVAPGWIETASSTEEEKTAGEHTPIGRSGTPQEVADLIAFLASDEATYITGQMIVIDGGNTIQDYKGPGGGLLFLNEVVDKMTDPQLVFNPCHIIITFGITNAIGSRRFNKFKHIHEKEIINIPIIFRHWLDRSNIRIGIVGKINRDPLIIRFA